MRIEWFFANLPSLWFGISWTMICITPATLRPTPWIS
jgi:hypothetical protein